MKIKTASCTLLFIFFSLLTREATAQPPLPCGQSLLGVIGSPADLAQYTFVIPAGGDIIALNLASTTANFTPRFRLYDWTLAKIQVFSWQHALPLSNIGQHYSDPDSYSNFPSGRECCLADTA
ncbi:MAG: hypothetical protein SF339_18790 [Blastocatellia bacterium]|nr:hypothetical protein [Blastocatellia bacterium]